jgi:alkane 1-monooxygenase
MTIALWTVTVAWLGPVVLPYLVLQAVIAFTLLEAVNFLEHYGMLRQKVGVPGHIRYERVNASHSWNSNNIATNVLLYHLQRHSDHHANPTRRYQALRDFEESPVLPTGYAGMILLSLVPPLWRKVMDPRVLGHFDGDITLANLQPRKSTKLLTKYGVAALPVAETVYSDSVVRTVVDNVTSARCPVCNYVYEVAAGDEHEGFAAGTSWSAIPDAWCCPDCGVREKVDFVLTSEP